MSTNQSQFNNSNQCVKDNIEKLLDPDPYSLFLFAMNSPQTKEKYVTRLKKFFEFIGLHNSSIAEYCKDLC